MTSTTLRGSCLCGAARYEATGEPRRFLHCHCSRCRKATGTGHASNLFLQPGSLRWLSGLVRRQVYPTATFIRGVLQFSRRDALRAGAPVARPHAGTGIPHG